MKIQAIMFMYNDFDRARFTIEKFFTHNPDIPILILNDGGKDPTNIFSDIKSASVHNIKSIWHKKTHCGKGSFGPEFFDILFEYGLTDKFTHTLYLETDVLTNRKLTVPPKYAISGVMNKCGPKEEFLYNYLNLSCDRLHSGCGGTIYSQEYFKVIKNKNFGFFKDMFLNFSSNYYSDMMASLAARVNGLSIGNWEEVSNFPAQYINGKQCPVNYSASLIHNYKV